MKVSNKMRRVLAIIFVVAYVFTIFGASVYAATPSAEDQAKIEQAKENAGKGLYDLAGLIADIFQKIGIFVIFIGGIQVAWAMSSDNPEMKGQAIKLIAAGILVTVMSTAYPILTNQ